MNLRHVHLIPEVNGIIEFILQFAENVLVLFIGVGKE